MPEIISPLIGILLVTQTPKNPDEVVFRWPPTPMVRPRLSRPQPDKFEPDGSWRAAYYNSETPGGYEARGNDEDDSEDDYKWTRPGIQVPRRASLSFPHSPPRSSRGPTPRPSNYSSYHSHNASPAHRHGQDPDIYSSILGYRPSLLANILSPKAALCHQKFELVVDELTFLGHPVYAGPDGGWGWEELYRSRAASIVERLPGTTERNFGERGALGFDRGGEQPGSYIPRSGSLIERPGLFTERLELSELPASTSSSFGALQTPRASKSHNSIGEARGRMPTRPPFELRMSSGDTILSPSPGVTPSSTTPISEPSSESSTVAHMTNSTRILPHMASNSTSASDADSAPQLTSFHLVLVIDKLDPQSVFPRDLHRYMDVFYQQIAFKMTAVMHYEQGRSGWVAKASEQLICLRDQCIVDSSSHYPNPNLIVLIHVCPDVPLQEYCQRALDTCPLAAAIKTVYESVTKGAVAHIQINDVPLDIQLPPRHAAMLGGVASTGIPEDGVDPHADFDQGPASTGAEDEFEDEVGRAEDARRFGWWLPRLLPWKGLLLLEDAGPGTGAEMIVRMNSGRMSSTGNTNGSAGGDEDALADEDMFRKFLTFVDPKLSLSDIAELSELNLKVDVYPMTRLLLYNRKARIVDVIPPGMKVIYTAAPAFKRPLPELSAVFSRLFSTAPPLPSLLATLTSYSRPFSSLVPSRDHRSFYFDVLVWLLRHGLLERLHLRVRVVATAEIRAATRGALARERENARLGKEVAQVVGRREIKRRRRKRSKASDEVEVYFGTASGDMFDPSSPELVRRHGNHSYRRRRSSRSSLSSEQLSRIPESLSVLMPEDALEEEEEDWMDDEDEEEEGIHGDGVGMIDALLEEDSNLASAGGVIIAEPAEATQLEMRWMEAMVEGKDPGISQRFHRIRKYFDGKITADEILYREDITRREFREVIHHFDTYLIVFLHP
ncbi:Nitrogen Permease regulator of amino acid transport 3, partial [Rhizoctonia solani]